MNEVASFLCPKDIFSVKFSSKTLYIHIDKDLICYKHLLRSLILEKNKEIKINKKIDFRLEYEITDSEVERLINELDLFILNKIHFKQEITRERIKELFE